MTEEREGKPESASENSRKKARPWYDSLPASPVGANLQLRMNELEREARVDKVE